MTGSGLQKWYGYIKSHDRAALWDLLHPDAMFESPVVHTPQRGRDITFKYLTSAENVLGGPTFAYVGEWRSQNGAVLEFTSEIDGVTINGVDIISFDADDRIKAAEGDQPVAPPDGGTALKAIAMTLSRGHCLLPRISKSR